MMVRRIASAWLACVICLAGTALHAEDFRISPLPLAEKARAKPERNAFEMLDADNHRKSTRYSVLIGMHDWPSLEKEYQALESAYRARTIDADEYVRRIRWFAPDNGQIQLADLEQWAKERPKSYIAWYTLGLQYENTAWDERGNRFSSQTSREQFAAMHKFGKLAHEAFEKSFALAPKPVASYSEMVGVAMLIERRETSESALVPRSMRAEKSLRCPVEAPAVGGFATSYEEQLYYVCRAYAADPAMSAAMGRFLYFQTPRWGGSFEDSGRLVSQFEAEKRMPAKTLGIVKARLLSQGGAELVDRNPKVAIQYLMGAFELDPQLRNAKWLRQAGEAAVWGSKDPATARACYDKLVALVPDDPEAWASRGWAYESMGDFRHYMEDMIAAAMLGKKEAQNNVGYYYMVGQRGLPRDLLQARAWLTLAANQGFQHSRDKLAMLEEMIRKEGLK